MEITKRIKEKLASLSNSNENDSLIYKYMKSGSKQKSVPKISSCVVMLKNISNSKEMYSLNEPETSDPGDYTLENEADSDMMGNYGIDARVYEKDENSCSSDCNEIGSQTLQDLSPDKVYSKDLSSVTDKFVVVNDKNKCKKALQCSHCSFSTNWPLHLKRHLLTHDPENCKVYRCENCNYTTHKAGAMKLHKFKYKNSGSCKKRGKLSQVMTDLVSSTFIKKESDDAEYSASIKKEVDEEAITNQFDGRDSFSPQRNFDRRFENSNENDRSLLPNICVRVQNFVNEGPINQRDLTRKRKPTNKGATNDPEANVENYQLTLASNGSNKGHNRPVRHLKCSFCKFKTRDPNTLEKHMIYHADEIEKLSNGQLEVCDDSDGSNSRASDDISESEEDADIDQRVNFLNLPQATNESYSVHQNNNDFEPRQNLDVSGQVDIRYFHNKVVNIREKKKRTKLISNISCSSGTIQKYMLPENNLPYSQENSYICQNCNFKTSKESVIKYHVQKCSNMSEECYQCYYCPFETVNIATLKAHSLIHSHDSPVKGVASEELPLHSDKVSDSQIDEEIFKNSLDVNPVNDFPSEDRTSSERVEERTSPLIKNESDKSPSKRVCIEEILNEYALSKLSFPKIHLELGEGCSKFKCNHCDYETIYRVNFRRHLLVHSAIKRFTCKFCDFDTNRKKTIQNHFIRFHKSAINRECEKSGGRLKFEDVICLLCQPYRTNGKLITVEDQEEKSNNSPPKTKNVETKPTDNISKEVQAPTSSKSSILDDIKLENHPEVKPTSSSDNKSMEELEFLDIDMSEIDEPTSTKTDGEVQSKEHIRTNESVHPKQLSRRASLKILKSSKSTNKTTKRKNNENTAEDEDQSMEHTTTNGNIRPKELTAGTRLETLKISSKTTKRKGNENTTEDEDQSMAHTTTNGSIHAKELTAGTSLETLKSSKSTSKTTKRKSNENTTEDEDQSVEHTIINESVYAKQLTGKASLKILKSTKSTSKTAKRKSNKSTTEDEDQSVEHTIINESVCANQLTGRTSLETLKRSKSTSKKSKQKSYESTTAEEVQSMEHTITNESVHAKQLTAVASLETSKSSKSTSKTTKRKSNKNTTEDEDQSMEHTTTNGSIRAKELTAGTSLETLKSSKSTSKATKRKSNENTTEDEDQSMEHTTTNGSIRAKELTAGTSLETLKSSKSTSKTTKRKRNENTTEDEDQSVEHTIMNESVCAEQLTGRASLKILKCSKSTSKTVKQKSNENTIEDKDQSMEHTTTNGSIRAKELTAGTSLETLKSSKSTSKATKRKSNESTTEEEDHSMDHIRTNESVHAKQLTAVASLETSKSSKSTSKTTKRKSNKNTTEDEDQSMEHTTTNGSIRAKALTAGTSLETLKSSKSTSKATKRKSNESTTEEDHSMDHIRTNESVHAKQLTAGASLEILKNSKSNSKTTKRKSNKRTTQVSKESNQEEPNISNNIKVRTQVKVSQKDKKPKPKKVKMEQGEYSCKLCPFSSIYNINLRRHTRRMHETEKAYNCKNCKYSTDKISLFRNHIANYHIFLGEKYQDPTIITENSKDEKLSNKTTNAAPSKIKLNIKQKAKRKYRKNSTNSHRKYFVNVNGFLKCIACDFVSVWKKNFKRHFITMHEVKEESKQNIDLSEVSVKVTSVDINHASSNESSDCSDNLNSGYINLLNSSFIIKEEEEGTCVPDSQLSTFELQGNDDEQTIDHTKYEEDNRDDRETLDIPEKQPVANLAFPQDGRLEFACEPGRKEVMKPLKDALGRKKTKKSPVDAQRSKGRKFPKDSAGKKVMKSQKNALGIKLRKSPKKVQKSKKVAPGKDVKKIPKNSAGRNFKKFQKDSQGKKYPDDAAGMEGAYHPFELSKDAPKITEQNEEENAVGDVSDSLQSENGLLNVQNCEVFESMKENDTKVINPNGYISSSREVQSETSSNNSVKCNIIISDNREAMSEDAVNLSLPKNVPTTPKRVLNNEDQTEIMDFIESTEPENLLKTLHNSIIHLIAEETKLDISNSSCSNTIQNESESIDCVKVRVPQNISTLVQEKRPETQDIIVNNEVDCRISDINDESVVENAPKNVENCIILENKGENSSDVFNLSFRNERLSKNSPCNDNKNSGTNESLELYKCSECNFKSPSHETVTQHMMSHRQNKSISLCKVGKRLLKCSLCNFKSRLQKELVSHLRAHNEEKKIKVFHCSLCNFKTINGKLFLSHRKVHYKAKELKVKKVLNKNEPNCGTT